MIFSTLRLILAFFLYLTFQVLLLNELVLWNVATPFVFILFLFMLPLSISTSATYLLAFTMGLIVDFTTDNYLSGFHAFSCLLAVATRRYILQLTLPSSFREANEVIWADQNNVWYVLYLLPLIFIHHTAYFFLEAFSLRHFFDTLFKIICSTLYTFTICYALCIVFYRRK